MVTFGKVECPHRTSCILADSPMGCKMKVVIWDAEHVGNIPVEMATQRVNQCATERRTEPKLMSTWGVLYRDYDKKGGGDKDDRGSR